MRLSAMPVCPSPVHVAACAPTRVSLGNSRQDYVLGRVEDETIIRG